MRFRTTGLSLMVVAFAVATPGWADPVKTEAVIVKHDQGHITARTRQGDITVVLSSTTAIREKTGLKRKSRAASALIPGLIIEIEGEQQGSTIHASEIDFKERDWRAAVATKAGTTDQFAQQSEQIQHLRQAIIDGHEYVIREEATVYFATGKAAVAPEYQARLRALAQKAPSFGNYRLSILGFADPRGDAAANERLSMKRAAAVSNFLRQSGHIEPGRVLSPSAMGEGTIAPGEAAPASDAEARRVVVRVVTPKTQLTK